MLVIFFSEYGKVGAYDVEQLGHHRGDSDKKYRPMDAAKVIRQAIETDPGFKPIGVQCGFVGGKHDVHLLAAAHFQVPLEITGIGVEVLRVTELNRVDEDTYNQNVRHSLAGLHQGNMPIVEIAHGGNKGDAFPFLSQALSGLLHMLGLVDDR